MPDLILSRLFRPEHVLAIADRTLDRGWEVLHSADFQAGVKNLEEGRLKGEANTREKVIEPTLYEILGYQRNENDSEHAIRSAVKSSHGFVPTPTTQQPSPGFFPSPPAAPDPHR